MPSILEVVDLTKRFGELTVIDKVSFSVEVGEVICVIGPSGSGKSTLLRCLNRLEAPSGGRVLIDGEEVTSRSLHLLRRHVGMVFQHFNLFPHLTVIENVMEGPRTVLKTPRAAARVRALELLDKVGLKDKAEARPANLSGGQQQRVAIARALAMEPRVMLFDEATSALDPEIIGEVLSVMKQLADEGMTMLVVTHEMDFAERVASRVFMFDGGHVVEEGPPEEIFRSAHHERTRRFLNQLHWEGQ